jgi:hypothetical protein
MRPSLSTPLHYVVRCVPSPINGRRWAVVVMLYRTRIEVVNYYNTRREAREVCRDYRREQEREILWAMFGDEMPVMH